MMRIAAIYDIHGNLPALEAVLKEIEPMGVDRLVVGGDVLLGPMPVACLDLLYNLPIPVHFVLGNCEAAVLRYWEDGSLEGLSERAAADVRWTADTLSTKHRNLISNWSQTLTWRVEGIGEVLFCHATPDSDTEIFTRLTPDERLRSLFSEVAANVVVCGHTHMQFDLTVGKIRLLNAGSVGMPFGIPGAYWLLMGPELELRKTNYDLNKAADRIRQTDYPYAEDFAQNSVVYPPNEEKMLSTLTRR